MSTRVMIFTGKPRFRRQVSYNGRMKQKSKAILVDILGFTCVIAAPFLGWIPGPGGIPLLILGLSLLATNHEWAARILERFKQEFDKAAKKAANPSPAQKWLIDCTGIIFIAVAVIVLMKFTQSMATVAGISLIIVATTLLATNADRYKRAWNKVPRKHKH